MSLASLDDSKVVGLEKPFSEEEVYGTLSSFSRDKAPSLDGFPMAFWSFLWEFVKIEVMNFFREFCRLGCFMHSLNATFLVAGGGEAIQVAGQGAG